ncbi:hypothetical protein ACFL3F_03140 [Planctomycetota bacterium]
MVDGADSHRETPSLALLCIRYFELPEQRDWDGILGDLANCIGPKVVLCVYETPEWKRSASFPRNQSAGDQACFLDAPSDTFLTHDVKHLS